MTLSRRSFFAGLAAAIAAPAVVKAESLMPVKVWRPDVWRVYGVPPGVASLADMLDFDRAVQRYAETLSMPNELLNCLTFERAEDAVAAANQAVFADVVAFGTGVTMIDPARREIIVGPKIHIPAGGKRENVLVRSHRFEDLERSHFVKRPSWWFG